MQLLCSTSLIIKGIEYYKFSQHKIKIEFLNSKIYVHIYIYCKNLPLKNITFIFFSPPKKKKKKS